MIDRVRFEANGDGSSRTTAGLQMTVGGPLKLDKESKYALPVTVKFVIIQSPERKPGSENEGHNPSEDERVRGVENVDQIDPKDPRGSRRSRSTRRCSGPVRPAASPWP